jgi:uncharacterized protein YegP (UPF0339 family)
MNRAVFEIKMNAVDRLYFIFRDSSGASIVTSKSFAGRASLERCIAGIRDTAPMAEIHRASECTVPPVFLIREGASGFFFDLVGYDGEIVFSSLQYKMAADCQAALRLFKNESPDAGLLDSI